MFGSIACHIFMDVDDSSMNTYIVRLLWFLDYSTSSNEWQKYMYAFLRMYWNMSWTDERRFLFCPVCIFPACSNWFLTDYVEDASLGVVG